MSRSRVFMESPNKKIQMRIQFAGYGRTTQWSVTCSDLQCVPFQVFNLKHHARQAAWNHMMDHIERGDDQNDFADIKWLMKYTVPQLREAAKKLGITGYSGMTKLVLQEAIEQQHVSRSWWDKQETS